MKSRLQKALLYAAAQAVCLNEQSKQPKYGPRRKPSLPGRNEPCPCGSGVKFKKCHGAMPVTKGESK